jgi:hypothetical protein
LSGVKREDHEELKDLSELEQAIVNRQGLLQNSGTVLQYFNNNAANHGKVGGMNCGNGNMAFLLSMALEVWCFGSKSYLSLVLWLVSTVFLRRQIVTEEQRYAMHTLH